MPKLVDLTGRAFGRLLVVKRAENKNGGAAWCCSCVCGAAHTVRGGDLQSGAVRSCGCLASAAARNRPEYHGLRQTGAYRAWQDMKKRCYTKNRKDYKHYGGRGIAVCVRWHAFANFYADMGERPDGMSLERQDNDKGYSPDNCCWADTQDQHRNQRSNIWLEVGTLRMIKTDWAQALGTAPTTIAKRLQRGWPVEAACTLPVVS